MPRTDIPASILAIVRSGDGGQFGNEILRLRGFTGGFVDEFGAGTGIGSYRPRTIGATEADPLIWGNAAFTWDGDPIPGRIIERTDIVSKEDGEQECTVTVNALPSDLPDMNSFLGTDAELSAVIPGTSDEAPLIRGLIVNVATDESTLRLRIKSRVHAFDTPVPVASTGPQCRLLFGSSRCGYTSTTQINGTQSVPADTNILVDDASLLEVGRFLKKNDAPLQITAVTTGGGTEAFQVGAFSSWNNNEDVVYGDCRKTGQDCFLRGQLHRFGGFRATQELRVSNLAAQFESLVRGDIVPQGSSGGRSWYGDAFFRIGRGFVSSQNPDNETGLGVVTAFSEQPRPLAYGYCVARPVLVERIVIGLDPGNASIRDFAVGWYVIGPGPIEEVDRAWGAGFRLQNARISLDDYDIGVDEMYYTQGTLGVSSNYTASDWRADRVTALDAHPNGMILTPQEVDFRSTTLTSYSGTSMFIYQIMLGVQGGFEKSFDSPEDLPDPIYLRGKWRRVQKYAGGSPDGAPVFSRNPAWILLDFLTDPENGPGYPLSAINLTRWEVAAAACDVEITNPGMELLVRTTMGIPLPFVPVVKADGIVDPGMTVTHGVTDYVVTDVLLNDFIQLDQAVQFDQGDILVGKRPRFTFDYYLRRKLQTKDFVRLILSSMNGRLVPEGGQLSLFVNRGIWQGDEGIDIDDVTRYLGMSAKNFKMERTIQLSKRHNVCVIRHIKGSSFSGQEGEIRVTDADGGGNVLPKEIRIAIPGSSTADQAFRNGMAQFAQVIPIDNDDGNNRFSSIGFTFETGIGGLEYMIGDWAEVDITVNPEGDTPRVLRQRGRVSKIVHKKDNRFVIEGSPERELVRLEGFGPAVDPFSDNLYVGGTAARVTEQPEPLLDPTLAISVGNVSARVVIVHVAAMASEDERRHLFGHIELHASLTQGFTPKIGIPGSGTRVAAFPVHRRRFAWIVQNEDFFTQLVYIRAAWIGTGGGTPIVSNEVSTLILGTTITDLDPTVGIGQPGNNMLYGGDFQLPWEATDPGETPVTPPAGDNLADPASTNPHTSPDNARDQDTGTNSSGAYTTSVGSGHIWHFQSDFPSTTLKNGRFWASISTAPTSGLPPATTAYYSLDSGGSWVQFGAAHYGPSSVFSDQLVDVDMNLARIKVSTPKKAKGGAGNGEAYELGFLEVGSGPYGLVGNGVGVVKGDGVNYGELRQSFPGVGAIIGEVVLAVGDQAVFQIRAWVQAGAADFDLEVLIEDTDSGATWPILTIDKTDMDSEKNAYADLFVPTSDIEGSLELVVRTKSTEPIVVDQAMIEKGFIIHDFTPHPQEIGYHGNRGIGRLIWPAGAWDPGNYKIGVPV